MQDFPKKKKFANQRSPYFLISQSLSHPIHPSQPAAIFLELAAHPALPLLALLLRPRDLHDLLLLLRAGPRALRVPFARFPLHWHGDGHGGFFDFGLGFRLGVRVGQDAGSPAGDAGRGACVAAWLGAWFDLCGGCALAAHFADFALFAGGEEIWAPGCRAVVVVAAAVAGGAVDENRGGGVCAGATCGFGA